MANYKYHFIEDGDVDKTPFFSDWPPDTDNINYIAQDLGEYYYSECDGWESHWPLTFEIFYGDNRMGVFQISMEYHPSFSATQT